MSKKIAVIGSNSFSGSDFIDLILEQKDWQVVGISRSKEKSSIFLPCKRHKKEKNFRFYQLDLNKNMKGVCQLLDSFMPDYIVNFAALVEVASSWQYPDQYFETNTLTVVRLINYLKDAVYLKRYLHISTPEVYGSCRGIKEDEPVNPSTPYAASKAAADLFLQTMFKNYQFPVVFIRSTNVYGPHQLPFRIIPKTIISIKLGKTIPLHGGGKAIKSFIHIRDVSRGQLLALEKGNNGEVYHLSPDEGGRPVRDVVKIICKKMGAEFGEVTKDVPERLGQDVVYIINSAKIRKTLGWKQNKTFAEGVNEVIEWVEENWKKIQEMPLHYIHKP